MSVLDPILEKSKDFEYLATTFDPVYDDLLIGIELVKNFIIEHKLIIYGGSAIDYALRLKGDNIYPDDMLKVPDLDFYSYSNVEHAYQLADILYHSGYKEARAIRGMHVGTMRVDIMSNHFIADITYRPKDAFDKLPYLEYNGMRIIHPHFQRIDIHSSLSFPYDDVPHEVIFSRWSKDIKRFNKLAQHYELEMPKEVLHTRSVKVPLSMRKYVLTGFSAYSLIYNDFIKKVKELGIKMPDNVSVGHFSVSEHIESDAYDQTLEIVHFDPGKVSGECGMTNMKRYEPYINLIPEYYIGNIEKTTKLTIFSTKNKLVAANSIRVKDTLFRVTNVQYLLKHFLCGYFVNQHQPKLAATYLSRYVSLTIMIQAMEDAVCDDKNKDLVDTLITSPLFLTAHTFGSENINLAREVALNRLENDLHDVPLYKVPLGYYPDKNLSKQLPHPKFDPEEIEFFRELGREIPL